MPKHKGELQKHTLNLYKGQFEKLKDLYPAVDPSYLIRELVNDLIDKTEPNELPTPKVEIKL